MGIALSNGDLVESDSSRLDAQSCRVLPSPAESSRVRTPPCRTGPVGGSTRGAVRHVAQKGSQWQSAPPPAAGRRRAAAAAAGTRRPAAATLAAGALGGARVASR
jgi:hypothetical protein